MSAETFLPLVGHGQLGDGGRGEELAKGPPVGQTLAPPPPRCDRSQLISGSQASQKGPWRT